MCHLRASLARGLLLLFLVAAVCAAAPSAAPLLPDPALDDALSRVRGRSTVVLAGGCFWGVQEVFQHVRGVIDTTSGYAGGSAATATYGSVSQGTTAHAESVNIIFDPSQISFGQILKIFFSVAHDPTQRNGQWPDIGPEYRSVIFYAGDRQQQLAKAYMDQLTRARVFRDAIATQLVPLAAFYPAEPFHQNYAARHPLDRYIVMIDLPKVEDLRKEYPAWYVEGRR